MKYDRTISLIGEAAFERLQQTKVILFGVGGVGGWCAEALVRTGIQHLTIVDFDLVADTNINRQVVATAANIGLPKVEQMRERLLSICPEADIVAINQRYMVETAAEFDLSQYDIIIDAIDSVDDKILLIHNATATEATLFSSMGAGRKLDPQSVRVAEFWKVEGCPLARALRTKMKKSGVLPLHKFQCVYSAETIHHPQSTIHHNGSLAPVVGTFGFTLASLAIKSQL
ncbi:MAG: tRNA threonylcarbamoyladenosine dehydratase [Paludibacteraceae bacterium]|nr:tRNA threonylcarbamoyladenosine dehydratase [Paludibacteraceae bacterium]